MSIDSIRPMPDQITLSPEQEIRLRGMFRASLVIGGRFLMKLGFQDWQVKELQKITTEDKDVQISFQILRNENSSIYFSVRYRGRLTYQNNQNSGSYGSSLETEVPIDDFQKLLPCLVRSEVTETLDQDG